MNRIHHDLIQLILKELADLLRDIGLPKEVFSPKNISDKTVFGDFSIPLHKVIKEKPQLKDRLSSVSSRSIKGVYIKKVEYKNNFLNIFINYENVSKYIFSTIAKFPQRYGAFISSEREKIIVEYVSANPIHPLHIGHLRNAVIGEAIARLLSRSGHEVSRHFYINDMGLQVAYAAYGFKLVGTDFQKEDKPDHYVGVIYSTIYLLSEIAKLKDKLSKLNNEEEIKYVKHKIDDLIANIARIRENNPDLVDALIEGTKDSNIESEVTRLSRSYEKKDPQAVKIIRKMCNFVLEGFKETLSELGIEFDSWDWESEVTVWNGLVRKVLEELKQTPFLKVRDGAYYLDGNDIVDFYNLREIFGIPQGYEIPPLTLTRSDGTSLYTLRDIAYSIWKFSRGVDRVINVIGIDQKLPQLYLRLALWVLGYKDEARKLQPYFYEFVRLKEGRMSSRRGVIVSVDNILKEAYVRALKLISNRKEISKEEREKISKYVARGALKYYILLTSPSKLLIFDWNKIFDFNQNTGPFVQYAYVRALSILEKASEVPKSPKKPVIGSPEEKELVKYLSLFPYRVSRSIEELRPDYIATYLVNLARLFHSFYEKYPVLKASEDVRETRLSLVYSIKVIFENGANMIGIELPKKM